MSTAALAPLSPSEPPRVFGAPTLSTESELLALGMNLDGTLWSVEEPGLLRQWSLGTRKQQGRRVLDELATAWCFNWAGRLLASGSDEVAVWEVASGEQLSAWKAPAWVTALAFQPGHAVLAVGHDDGVVQVWDWAARKMMIQINAHPRGASALAFSFDGKRLATAGEDRLVHVWDLADGDRLATMAGHRGRIPTLSWHPDNRRLFSAGWDTTVRVWDAATGEPIILLNDHAREVHAAALSADGRLLASADADSTVRVWDAATYQELAALHDSSAEVRCLCWTPDDDRGNLRPPMLAYGGADRVIYLWDSRQGPDSGAGADAFVLRTCLAISPDGGRLFSLGSGTELRAWDEATGEPAASLEDAPALRAFALSPNGQWLAASRAEDGTATLGLYQSATGHRQSGCDGQAAPITALAFSPSSSILASAGVRSSDVWLWTVPFGSPILLLNDALDGCSVGALAWHPGGQFLAVGGIDWMATGKRDGEVAIWDPHARTLHKRIPGGVTALAYHPSGDLLAAAGLSLVIRLYAADGSYRELTGHQDTIHALAFSKDGRWLASGSEDRTIRLWDVASGRQAGAWELENAVRAAAFGPEGKFLYTGNGNTSCYQIEIEALLG